MQATTGNDVVATGWLSTFLSEMVAAQLVERYKVVRFTVLHFRRLRYPLFASTPIHCELQVVVCKVMLTMRREGPVV